MKKLLFFLSMIILPASVFAQGIYIRAGAGYGLPAATTQIGEKYLHAYVYDGNNYSDTYSNEIVSGSYGSGIDFSFAAGYEFNRNFLFDINVQYLVGKKYQTSDIYTVDDISYSGSSRDIITTSARGLFFNPALVFSVGFGKGAPYGRLGFVAASPKIVRDESSYYDLDGTSTSDIRWEYNKGLALGYQIAVGINWKLTDKIDFYSEAGFINMTFYASEGTMTKNIQDGSNILDQLTVAQKEIQFRKKYDPYLPYDPAQPQITGRQASPLSSISAQIGIRYILWRKNSE